MDGKKLLLSFARAHIWSYLLGFVILTSSTIIALIIPKILGLITDTLNNNEIVKTLISKYIAAMIVLAIAAFTLKLLWRYLLLGNTRTLEVYLRDNLFKHLLTLPVDFFNNHKTGELISYAITDIQAVRFMFGGGMAQALEGLLVSIISVVYMYRVINPALTIYLIMPIPLAVVIMYILGKMIRKRYAAVQKAIADISDKVQENISGIRIVKSFAQEQTEINSFSNVNFSRLNKHIELIKVSGLLAPSLQVCFGVSFMLFIIYGSKLIAEGTITIGDFVACNSYMLAIMGAVMMVSRIVEVLQRGIASFKRLNVILTCPAGYKCEHVEELGSIKGSIEIRNLSYTYPRSNRQVLKNINLKVEQGKTLGIIGRTGAGKTTLVNLLLRLFDVDYGHIFIDGIDINNIPPEHLREYIGFVPQDSFLFSTTIRNNIEFFRQVYTDDEIENSARLSDVYENIIAFPDGFDTIVGERGVNLSGGQKQRISIARALIKESPILVLDDSLSAVDSETENRILANIREVLRSRTSIIISHRVSAVKDADEIILLENGRIVERGTHKALTALGGRYFRLYHTQESGAEEADLIAK